MADIGHQLTEDILSDLEDRMRKEYERAVADAEKKLADYLKKFEKGKAEQKALLDAGKITDKEYQNWIYRHTMMGKQWEHMRNVLAEDLHRTNEIALQMARGQMPDIYATNANYATYQIENGGQIDTGFTLYNHDTAEILMREDNIQLMPRPSTRKAAEIAANKDMQWNMRHIQSAVLQGVMQGESPWKVADRLRGVGQMDFNSSVRYARTMGTSAQNAGRYKAYERADALGVKLTIEWQATLDDRTRHDHRMMHGQRRDVGEPFITPDGYSILWPADSSSDYTDAPQSEIWNCRCTLLSWVKGFEGDTITSSPKMGEMSFEEWQQAKAPKPREENVAPEATQAEDEHAIMRNYDSPMAKGIGRDQYDSVCDMLDRSENDDVRDLYARHLNDVGVGSTTEPNAYQQFGKIYYDRDRDSSTSTLRKEHSTYFHETGHGVDWKIGREKGMLYYSQNWNNGEFSRTIRSEVGSMVEQRASELKAEFKKHRSDFEWLKANGYLSDFAERNLRQYANWAGVSFEDVFSGKVKVDRLYRDLVPKFSKDKAYKSIEDEVKQLIRGSDDGNWKAHSLSDILEGATSGKIQAGWGHGKSYWSGIDVSIEAFAEISEAYVSGPESLEVLRQWLPETVKTYDRMIAEYLGR